MLGLKEAVEGLLSLASTVRADATACDSTGSDLDGDTARECTEDSRTRLSCSEDDLSAGATVGSWGAKRMRTVSEASGCAAVACHMSSGLAGRCTACWQRCSKT